MMFKGFRRTDGKVGIRNYVLLLPTSICSTQVATEIASKIKGCTSVSNSYGCCQIGNDARTTFKTLVNIGKNPNVGAIIVVALGCEGIEATQLTDELYKTGKPVTSITIQELGGTLKATARGCEIARDYSQQLSLIEREECNLSELILGMECGGSDATSGLAANPVVGISSDLLVNAGGTSILSETTEMIGAEHILANRCVNPRTTNMLLAIVQNCEERAKEQGQDIRGSQPTPGNIEGGLTTIEEKSLGCLYKAGKSTIQGVLEYGDIPDSTGLFVMDTPGQDIVSITGMVAGGAQLCVFTTGRGTPTGNPIAPIIKITANKKTYEKMSDNIDLDVSDVIAGKKSISEAGQYLFEEIIRVANGKTTKAEELGHNEFSIYKTGFTF
jgi:altronate dehydratase large subunit